MFSPAGSWVAKTSKRVEACWSLEPGGGAAARRRLRAAQPHRSNLRFMESAHVFPNVSWDH